MICTGCGVRNAVGTHFCTGCGTYLSWSGQQPPDEQQPQTSFQTPAEQQAGMRMDLDPAVLSVNPGESVRAQVTVYNTGTRVERFTLTVTGTAARWAVVTPAELTVYPGNAATATVTFAPPRSPAGPAGTWDFGVQAVSLVSGGLRESMAGTLAVGRFSALTALLSPIASRGGGRTRHALVLENQGNAPEELWLSATDAENELRIELPAQIRLNPGKAEVPVEVEAVPATFGIPKRVPFQVVVTPSGERPVTVDGTRIVSPRFGRWPLVVAPLVAIALVAGVIALTRTSSDPPVVADKGRATSDREGSGENKSDAGPKATPEPATTKPQEPPPAPSFFAGKGELVSGAAEISVPSLTLDAKIFLTPDLTAISGAGTTVAGGLHTEQNLPAAALRVVGRGQNSFQVEAVAAGPPDGLHFSYLAVNRLRGTLGTLPYEAGSALLPAGQSQVALPNVETATPQSVIILTVEGGSQTVRVDNKTQGGFTVATVNADPATSDIGFNFIVVDPSGGEGGKVKAAAGFGQTTWSQLGNSSSRLENKLINDKTAVLATTNATGSQSGSPGAGYADVCVVVQGSGFAEVEPFALLPPSLKIAYDWLAVT